MSQSLRDFGKSLVPCSAISLSLAEAGCHEQFEAGQASNACEELRDAQLACFVPILCPVEYSDITKKMEGDKQPGPSAYEKLSECYAGQLTRLHSTADTCAHTERGTAAREACIGKALCPAEFATLAKDGKMGGSDADRAAYNACRGRWDVIAQAYSGVLRGVKGEL
mmetsp:Transcript_12690/g.40103  ORF Transcript_12690/g.40103 Transcript_12690/m.40103 type:complete len:167 (-) Transcript_12690:387-887(-)